MPWPEPLWPGLRCRPGAGQIGAWLLCLWKPLGCSMTLSVCRPRRLAPLALLVAGAASLAALPAQAQEKFIVMASTTSTEQSGLFKHLLPLYQQKTGVQVRVVALGTGQALDLARRGDADVAFVHARAADEAEADWLIAAPTSERPFAPRAQNAVRDDVASIRREARCHMQISKELRGKEQAMCTIQSAS